MITNDRIIEKKYLLKSSYEKMEDCGSFYPFLRQGLFNFLKSKEYKSVSLPYFIPEGMYEPFISNGYEVFFYDIDENGFIDESIFSKKVDVFVYIHYFGLYNFQNMDIIKRNRKKYKVFIEDFAHTIFNKSLLLTGDLCTFSFTKMIGVPEGSCILYNNLSKEEVNYTPNTLKTLLIKIDLQTEIYFKSNFKFFYKPMSLFKRILRLNYYDILMKNYKFEQPRIGKYSRDIIEKIDYEKINKIRISFAEYYFENINKELLLDIPKEYYCYQSLFAFPIKVKNRDIFVKKLYLNGISAFSFAYRWSFGNMIDRKMFDNHLLLPINHNLDLVDIKKIVSTINKIKKGMENND